jgi:hypothetical protein
MLFKKCPRCDGDMYLEVEVDGKSIVCIQCGSRQYPSFPAPPLFVIASEQPSTPTPK